MLLTTAGRTRYYIILLYAISFANNNKPNWVRLLRTITTTTTTTTTKSLLQKKKKKKKLRLCLKFFGVGYGSSAVNLVLLPYSIL